MRRRDFIKAIAGLTIVWPVAARAQQAVRRVGVFLARLEDEQVMMARTTALLQGLGELGWNVGRNLRIDYGWTTADVEHIRRDAAEMVALGPSVIVAPGSATLGSVLQATRTVPIVFVHVPDPVGAGFVDSLSRPGGNATGFVSYEY